MAGQLEEGARRAAAPFRRGLVADPVNRRSGPVAGNAAAGARAVGVGPGGFVVRVPDDAMRPAFRAGDFAYVDPDVPVVPGAFVCARRGGKTTVRLCAEEELGRRLLRTLEPDRVEGAVDADDGTTIRGVVVLLGRRVGEV